MHDIFYRELARRVITTANALQYERAAQLLCFALDAVDWQVEAPPLLLREAWGALNFYLNTMDLAEVDSHEYQEKGFGFLEEYLKTPDVQSTAPVV